jgi:mucin-19
MTSPSNSAVQNLLPVQAYFDLDNNFVTFIGQGLPFYATIDPSQSGLNITNSVINSTTIGLTVPAAGAFTSFSTNTGTIATQPVGATDIVNLLALQSYAAGISWKQPCAVATLTNITLSGLQTIDTYTTLAGDRVLVKDQSTAANNGIYIASAGPWTRALDANIWDELVAAISFIEYGTQKGGAWFCTAQPGGTLGVTAVNWSQFTTSATYTAGTGLTLTGFEFSITNTGVPASTYGSATATPVFAVNAQGQITSVTNTTITPAIGNVTGLGANMLAFLQTPSSANLAATVTDETGSGALVFATSPTLVTPALGTPASGDFSTGTFTWPTFNQNTTGTAAKANNLVGGAAGSVPYQSALDTTTFLAAGANGQVLTLASGVPSWATPTTGTVTSIATAGTVNGLTLTGGPITSTGTITLGGTLDLSAPPAIGGTTANTITGTTITANTKFVGPYFDAANSAGGALRTASGTACFQWGAGGSPNCTVDTSININGANAQVDISPTGTGHVHMKPTGTGAVEIAPTNPGTMNNMVIGGTTPLAGTFTDLRFNGTLSAAGSTGTAGFVMTSNGASAPTWQALPATGVTITDDTTTNATRYLAFTSATSGSITGQNVSSTKLQFNPSTGALTATSLTPTNALGASYGGTGLTSPGTNGNVLTSNGTAWVSSTLSVTPTAVSDQTNTSTGYFDLPSGTSAQRPGTPGTGMIRYNTSESKYEVYTGTAWVPISTSNYTYTASYLIVAGGGGGAGSSPSSIGGGGGAGGFQTGSATFTQGAGTVYSAVVGSGGAVQTAGNNSSFNSVTSNGGGRGGNNNATATSGGSGGGGGGGVPATNGAAGTSGQGTAGGNGQGGAPYAGGGGGGATSAGGDGLGDRGGPGGNGTASSITGSSVTYAGGGGGGANSATFSTGGAGGGGNGNDMGGTAGSANTGGGGGGGGQTAGTGGTGGSGVVILSIPTAFYSGTVTGSPTVTTSGTNTIITFTSSGTYTS